MRTILVDGSNVGLYSANARKLTTLTGLARVLNALLAHDVLPYTMFDASFRYRTSEDSSARSDFQRLKREAGEFFPLAPVGEEADLFLLEAALTTGYPILSNDQFREYGGVKGNVIRYKKQDVSVFNFSVLAGSVIIPDLDIRHRISLDDDNLDDIVANLAAVQSKSSQDGAEGIVTPDEHAADHPTELDSETLNSIDRVVHRYVANGPQPLDALGKRLTDYKRKFAARTGAGKKSKRIWFGFPTLRAFIAKALPRYKLGANSIEEGKKPDG